MVLERFHVETRRTDAVAGEECTRVKGLDVDVPRGLCVDLGKNSLGEGEQALELWPDPAIGAVTEVWGQLLDHAEQVLHGDVERFPSLRGLTHTLEDGLELREDDESAVCMLREHEPTLVLRRNAVVAGHFARDVRVEALNQLFNVAKVQPREMRFEDICALDGRPRCPLSRVRPVRPLGTLVGEHPRVS